MHNLRGTVDSETKFFLQNYSEVWTDWTWQQWMRGKARGKAKIVEHVETQRELLRFDEGLQIQPWRKSQAMIK